MNMIYPVSTIDDMYHACDPDKPLDSIEDARYEDLWEVRGQTENFANNVLRTLKRFGNVENPSYFRMLFSGHVGSGKTTELLRLKSVLEKEKFFVVYFDVINILDISNVEYSDILLTIAEQLCLKLEKNKINLPDILLEDLQAWFDEKIIEKESHSTLGGEVKAEVKAEGSISFLAKLLATVNANFKYAGTRRITIREKVEKELPVFMEKLDKLITSARQHLQEGSYKDLVIIVDGLEKMSFSHPEGQEHSNHHKLFVLQGAQLKINSHIIYTVPITLAYQTNLQNIFAKVRVMPMVKVRDQDNNESNGKEVLRNLVSRRVLLHTIFEDVDMVDELIELSGGVVRDLMLLLRTATDTDEQQIGRKEINYTKAELIKSYARQIINLTQADKEALRAVYHKQFDSNMSSYERLTNNRVILEYENGEVWKGLHPAVLELESIKTLLNVSTNG